MIKNIQYKKYIFSITIITILYIITQQLLNNIFIGNGNIERNIQIKESIEYFQNFLLILAFVILSFFTSKKNDNKEILKHSISIILINTTIVITTSFLLNIPFADTLYIIYVFVFSTIAGFIFKFISK